MRKHVGKYIQAVESRPIDEAAWDQHLQDEVRGLRLQNPEAEAELLRIFRTEPMSTERLKAEVAKHGIEVL